MGKKEDYKKMLKDKSFIFTPENEVVPNEYNPNKPRPNIIKLYTNFL